MNLRLTRIVLRAMAVVALTSIGIASAADAPANPPPDKGERRAVAQACRPDAERLCANVEKGGGRKMICLRDHLSELSPACRDGLAQLAANRKNSPPR